MMNDNKEPFILIQVYFLCLLSQSPAQHWFVVTQTDSWLIFGSALWLMALLCVCRVSCPADIASPCVSWPCRALTGSGESLPTCRGFYSGNNQVWAMLETGLLAKSFTLKALKCLSMWLVIYLYVLGQHIIKAAKLLVDKLLSCGRHAGRNMTVIIII